MDRFDLLRAVAVLFCLTVSACLAGNAIAGLNTDEHVGFAGDGETIDNGDGSYTVFDEGGVGDIWTDGDDFQYFYDSTPWSDDFSATVRVVSSTENISGRWGKAGIMARAEPLVEDSAFVMFEQHTGNERRLDEPPVDLDGDVPRLAWRASTGDFGDGTIGRKDFLDAPAPLPPEPNGVPIWFRLDRVGDEFFAWWALDEGGSPGEWQDEFTTGPLPDMGGDVTLGLAYSAHNSLPPGMHGVTFDNYKLEGPGAGGPELQAGDADQNLEFNQLDLVKVQIAAKYLTGQAATWGEGDWDGAPGGEQGSPPAGNGLFDQQDIVAALIAGTYLKGPYAAIKPGGTIGDGQTSIVYNAGTGEVQVDAPAGTELTSINIDSATAIFTAAAAENLGGSFDNDADNNIFKATFGNSFASLSFGPVAQANLSQDFVANDLSVVGSLAGGGDLGEVDLVYIPEPSTLLLVGIALIGIGVALRRRRK